MHACIGEGHGNPLQYSCLENPRDRGAWWAAVYGVAQSWTRLKRLSSSSSSMVYQEDDTSVNNPQKNSYGGCYSWALLGPGTISSNIPGSPTVIISTLLTRMAVLRIVT